MGSSGGDVTAAGEEVLQQEERLLQQILELQKQVETAEGRLQPEKRFLQQEERLWELQKRVETAEGRLERELSYSVCEDSSSEGEGEAVRSKVTFSEGVTTTSVSQLTPTNNLSMWDPPSIRLDMGLPSLDSMTTREPTTVHGVTAGASSTSAWGVVGSGLGGVVMSTGTDAVLGVRGGGLERTTGGGSGVWNMGQGCGVGGAIGDMVSVASVHGGRGTATSRHGGRGTNLGVGAMRDMVNVTSAGVSMHG